MKTVSMGICFITTFGSRIVSLVFTNFYEDKLKVQLYHIGKRTASSVGKKKKFFRVHKLSQIFLSLNLL